MSIIILSLGMEQGNSCHARVLCGDHEFDAFISGNKACLEPLLNEEIYVEIAFEQVISWRELDEFSHDQSGVKAAQDTEGAIILTGRVRNIVNIDDAAKIIDIDLELGSEFLTLSSEELQGKLPALGNGVEVVVSGLCFYLVNI